MPLTQAQKTNLKLIQKQLQLINEAISDIENNKEIQLPKYANTKVAQERITTQVDKINHHLDKQKGYSDEKEIYQNFVDTLRQHLAFDHIEAPKKEDEYNKNKQEHQAKLANTDFFKLLSKQHVGKIQGYMDQITEYENNHYQANRQQQKLSNRFNIHTICTFNTGEHDKIERPVEICYYDQQNQQLETSRADQKQFDQLYYPSQDFVNYPKKREVNKVNETSSWSRFKASDLITLMDYWWINNHQFATVATWDQIQQFNDNGDLTINEANKSHFLEGFRQFAKQSSQNQYDAIKKELAMDWLPENLRELLIMASDRNYLQEISNNYDHFYPHALFCYKTGHELAQDMMIEASQAEDQDEKHRLVTFAVQLEAFAQHAFSDCYAGGHLLIDPEMRRELHQQFSELGSLADTVVNALHNNGNQYGIPTQVTDKDDKIHYPICYGDGHLDQPANQRAVKLCREGLSQGYQQLMAAYQQQAQQNFDEIRGYFPKVLSSEDYESKNQEIKNYFQNHAKDFNIQNDDNQDQDTNTQGSDNQNQIANTQNNTKQTAESLYQSHKPIAHLVRRNNRRLEVLSDPHDLNPDNATYKPLTTWRLLKIAWQIITGNYHSRYKKSQLGKRVKQEVSTLLQRETAQINSHISRCRLFFLPDKRVQNKKDFLRYLSDKLQRNSNNATAYDISRVIEKSINELQRDSDYFQNITKGVLSHRVKDFIQQYGGQKAFSAINDKINQQSNQTPQYGG